MSEESGTYRAIRGLMTSKGVAVAGALVVAGSLYTTVMMGQSQLTAAIGVLSAEVADQGDAIEQAVALIHEERVERADALRDEVDKLREAGEARDRDRASHAVDIARIEAQIDALESCCRLSSSP